VIVYVYGSHARLHVRAHRHPVDEDKDNHPPSPWEEVSGQ